MMLYSQQQKCCLSFQINKECFVIQTLNKFQGALNQLQPITLRFRKQLQHCFQRSAAFSHSCGTSANRPRPSRKKLQPPRNKKHDFARISVPGGGGEALVKSLNGTPPTVRKKFDRYGFNETIIADVDLLQYRK